jgi:four helix bundle protein
VLAPVKDAARRGCAAVARKLAILDRCSARALGGSRTRATGRKENVMLEIYGVILEVVRELRPVIARIERSDSDLGRQMRRAACSVALNVAEGMGSAGGNRTLRYRTALGSMQETMACVQVGAALGYLEGIDDALEDRMCRIIGTLVRLTRR